MKLTKGMFDFEKYDYFDHLTPVDGGEWLNRFDDQWHRVTGEHYGLCTWGPGGYREDKEE